VAALTLLVGALIGFFGAIPPGPVGLAVLRLGLEEGRGAGMRAGLGALLVDVPCAFVAAAASGWVLGAAEERVDPAVALVVRLAASALLLAIGASWILRPHEPDPGAPPASGTSDLLVGFGLAAVHVASPTFLPWLTVITGTLQARGLLAVGLWPSLGFAAGFGLGTFAWFALVATFAARMREKASGGVLVAAQRFAGAVLVAFAGLLLYETLRP
jgi:threonine/homoserine/homoserine lactone efflux protein